MFFWVILMRAEKGDGVQVKYFLISTLNIMWEMSVFNSHQIVYPCMLKVSGCEEEVCDRIKRTATKGTKSTCGTKRHQLNNGNEIFQSENVSCRRF